MFQNFRKPICLILAFIFCFTLFTGCDGEELSSSNPGSIEEQIKNDTGYKSRCIIEEEKPTGKCIVCGKEATCRIYVGKQY